MTIHIAANWLWFAGGFVSFPIIVCLILIPFSS